MMTSEWLTAESFERNHRLLSAINTLSIHTKLALTGIAGTQNIGNVDDAREELLHFLERVAPLIHDVEANRDAPILGTDERLSSLVHRYAAVQAGTTSALHNMPISQVPILLDSQKPADEKLLVEYLAALRQVIEQHAHADVVGLLGEI